jgi:hypothetical protein
VERIFFLLIYAFEVFETFHMLQMYFICHNRCWVCLHSDIFKYMKEIVLKDVT